LFFGSHPFIGVLALVITTGLAASTYVHFVLLNRLWGYWRGTAHGRGDLAVGAKQIITDVVISTLSQQHESAQAGGQFSPH
jgi:hypothetical protein